MEKKKKCQSSDHSEINIQIKKRESENGLFLVPVFVENMSYVACCTSRSKNAQTFQNVVIDEKSHRFSDTGKA